MKHSEWMNAKIQQADNVIGDWIKSAFLKTDKALCFQRCEEDSLVAAIVLMKISKQDALTGSIFLSEYAAWRMEQVPELEKDDPEETKRKFENFLQTLAKRNTER